MKILMLNYEFPPLGGGASSVSYEIAKGYVELGHSVDVVTMGFEGLPKFEIVNGINVYRVPCIRSRKEICHPHEMLTYIFSAKRFLRKHLKENKYKINHTHFIIPTGIISLWVKKKFGIPYIITSHGSDVLGYNKNGRFNAIYPLLTKIWKKIIKEAKSVTTPSRYLQNEIKKITTEGNFIVIPNGIDPRKFRPLKKEKYILCVSRLFVNKGIQDLMKALEGMDLKGWKVKIVGDGTYSEELHRLRKEYHLEACVEFLGWIDNKSDRMRELYGHASIFVLPSYFENMSIALLEALASGCNVIASNVGGNPEVVGKENLFEATNIEELKNKIKNVIYHTRKPRSAVLKKEFNLKSILKNYENLVNYHDQKH
jgi:glycosyltransferase involved in cell wall biosynthesis